MRTEVIGPIVPHYRPYSAHVDIVVTDGNYE